MRDRLPIFTFLLCLLLPLVTTATGTGTRVSDYELRQLRPRPDPPRTWRGLAPAAGAWLDYFNDHFGLRGALISAHAALSLRGFHVSPSPTVILGRDGWLFYADDGSMEDYISATPLSGDDLEMWRQEIVGTRDWLRQRQIGFILMIAPDKHIIYPEFLPASIHPLSMTRRSDQLIAYLRAHSDVTIVDPREALVARKPAERVYFKTDTHWNDRGAFVGYETLLRAAGRIVPGLAPLDRSAFTPVERDEPGGDLADMLGVQDVMREPDQQLAPKRPPRAVRLEPATMNEGYEVARVVTEIPDPRLPRVVVFRDSFMSQMIPFVSEHFSRAVYMWQNDVDREVVAEEKPALVILEIVGRRFQTN